MRVIQFLTVICFVFVITSATYGGGNWIVVRCNPRRKILLRTTGEYTLGFGAADHGWSTMVGHPHILPNATTPATSYSFDDNGYAFGVTLGWNWADSDVPLRTEIEYMYHGDYADKFSTSHNSTDFSYSNEIDIHTALFQRFMGYL